MLGTVLLEGAGYSLSVYHA